MDAITECEQLARCQGRPEATAPWRLQYRKELFTPWYNPGLDQAATELIYRQIVDGVHSDEYPLHHVRDNLFSPRSSYVSCPHSATLSLPPPLSRSASFRPRAYATAFKSLR